MRDRVRTIPLLIVVICLNACTGLAHSRVEVPAVDVQISFSRQIAEMPPLRGMCPQHWEVDEGIIGAIAPEKLTGESLTFAKLSMVDNVHLKLACPNESRYIGFLIVAGLPFGPSDVSSSTRQILLISPESGVIYNLTVQDAKVKVAKASIYKERIRANNLPTAPPTNIDRSISAWYEEAAKWVSKIQWTLAPELEITSVKRVEEATLIDVFLQYPADG